MTVSQDSSTSIIVLTNRNLAMGEYARNKLPFACAPDTTPGKLRGAVQYPSARIGRCSMNSFLSDFSTCVRLPKKEKGNKSNNCSHVRSHHLHCDSDGYWKALILSGASLYRQALTRKRTNIRFGTRSEDHVSSYAFCRERTRVRSRWVYSRD